MAVQNLSTQEQETAVIQQGDQFLSEGKLEEATAAYTQAILLNSNSAAAYTKLGEVFASQGQYNNAITCFRRAIQIEPEFDWLHYNLGVALINLDQLPQAIKALERATSLNPDFAWSYYYLGYCQLSLRKTKGAIVSFQQAIQLNPSLAWAHFYLGEAFCKQEQFDQAVAAYSRALELQPDLEQAKQQRDIILLLTDAGRSQAAEEHIQQGQSHQKAQQWEAAADCYRRALEIVPQDWQCWHELGESLFHLQDWQEAIAAYRHAIELNPDAVWSHHNLGMLYGQLQQWDEALKCHAQVEQLQPDFWGMTANLANFQIQNHRGKIFFQQQQWQPAIEAFQQALTIDQDALTYYFLGEALSKLEQEEEAMDAYLHALNLGLDSKLASKFINRIDKLIARADRAFQQSIFDKALHFYQTVQLIDAQNYHACLRVGECLYRLSRYAEAETALANLVAEFGEIFWPLICLGQTYSAQSKFSEAKESLKKAIALNDDNFWAWNLLGNAYKALNEYQEAIACFKQITKLTPDKSLGYLSLGELFKKLGQTADAEASWKKAIEIEPSNKWSHISLCYLYIEAKAFDQANSVAKTALQIFPEDFDVVFAVAHISLSKRDWTTAAGMLERALSLNPNSQEVKVRLLELYCYAGNLAAAKRYLEELETQPNLPNSFYQAAAKLYSETGNWDKAFGFAGESVIREPHNIHNHRLFLKTARRAQRCEEALLIIDRAMQKSQATDPQLLMLKSSVLEHLVQPIDQARQCVAQLEAQPQASKYLTILDRRLKLKENFFPNLVPPSRKIQTRFFYCTDKAYSLPTLVSIFSLHKHNHERLNGEPIYVVAEPSTLELLEKAYTTLASRIGLAIQLVDISSLVQDITDINLTTNYGVFTGGDSLAHTAYYRLFFAQYLNRFGSAFRWLYIDSDTLVIDSLEEIDRVEFNGKPIAARRERDKPEIEEAIKLNNLESGRYYNSGVIAFDPTHPQLQSLLQEAVRVSIEEGHKLLYHDQCALNIAFDDQIANLPDGFNDFYPPSDERDLDELILGSQSSIIHLLDRPKPWDSLNHHRSSILWFQMLEEMSRFVPFEYIKSLYDVLQASI